MSSLETEARPAQPIEAQPARLAKDVVPASVGEALRLLAREVVGTTKAYVRMIEWPKDVSWKQVTLASIDRIGFAIVGVAVAVVRAARFRKRGGG